MNDFISENVNEFLVRHGIDIASMDGSSNVYYEMYDWEIELFCEEIYDLIPKVYKKSLPAKYEIDEVIESYVPKEHVEASKPIKAFLFSLVKKIFAAVEQDREGWNKIPYLPTMSPRGRKRMEQGEHNGY